MNRLILSLSIMVISCAAFSQRQYFIYLQSEPEQAFFIKMNEKIHSSTPSGYLIISKLKDSIYNFSIRFPQNKWPEQKFTIDIKTRDRGYLLKNFGEKGWGLFDLQTSSIQMGSSISNTSQKTEQREVSAFTDILSKASNDPSLKERQVSLPVVSKDNNKTGTDEVVIKKEEPLVVKKEEPPVISKEETPEKTEEVKTIPVEEYRRSIVTKRSESSTSEGLGLTFIDDNGNGRRDTISIFIPNQKINFAEIKEPVKEEKKFLDISEKDTVKKNEPGLKPIKTEALPSSNSAKKSCSSIAEESDFLKLRKKMAAETKDEAMVNVANKYFKTKCFATSQIKNLGALFLNDYGKYKFFDAAYIHVSDPDNFPSLEAELKDEYYKNRFKAMLR